MVTYHIQVKTKDVELIEALNKIVNQTNEQGRGQVTAKYRMFDEEKHQMSFSYKMMPRAMFDKIVYREIKKGINKKFPKAKVILVGKESIKEKVKRKVSG